MMMGRRSGEPSSEAVQPSNGGGYLLLQVSQVRCLLNRSRARIYEMCATGELESFRDGRSILIPRDAVDAWIIRKRRQGRR